MNKFTKRFQVWIKNPVRVKYKMNWTYFLYEFDTLEEAIYFNKNTDDWFLSESLHSSFCLISTLKKEEKKEICPPAKN